MVDNPPLIYGLDHECRAMCSHFSEYLPTRFFVGTQSIKPDVNQIHLLEYIEENNSLSKAVFRHGCGEIWNLVSFSKHPQNILSCYSTYSNKLENHFSIWQLPIDLSRNLSENENQVLFDLKKIWSSDQALFDESLGRVMKLRPEEENELMLMLETKVALLDVETKNLISYVSIDSSNAVKNLNRQSKITTFDWSPHFNGNIVSLVNNSNVYSKDLRSSSLAFQITQAHCQIIHGLDFNPNSQYYLATCGDDLYLKFWDIRNTNKPTLKILHHSHWIWAVRYNSFHDHLVLSSSSDGNVNLLRVSSIASQPYGHSIEDELDDEDITIKGLLTSNQQTEDALIRTFEDHADSVYAVEWSPNDPWIFASLSYDGRFIINKVPESEKLTILS